jgi:V/A-type H+-transporting ATPase subunit F
MTFSVAIVGSREEIFGFSALGLETFPVNTTEEARDVLFRLKKQLANEEKGKEKFAIVFVIENFIKALPPDEYAKLSSGALPAIIPLPGNNGTSGFGDEKIRRIVEKAVGSDIFGDE